MNHNLYSCMKVNRENGICSLKGTQSHTKKQISITGTLTNILVPGFPAVYLYHGNLIRTTAVEAILEASPNHIRFETREAVYTLSYKKTAVSKSKTA